MAAYIRACREAHGYSQEYMSAMLDLSQSTYASLEAGKTKINVDRLFEIVEILDIDIHHLIDEILVSGNNKARDMKVIYERNAKERSLMQTQLILELKSEIISLKELINSHPWSLYCTAIAHPPQWHDHPEGQCNSGDDGTDSKEHHFILYVVDDPGLSCDMKMGDQRLQTTLINEIAKITEGRWHHKKQDPCDSDDKYFKPFGVGDQCGGQ